VTEAIDDYLKAIFELAEDGGRATTASIAKKLGVAAASVTGMLRKLAEQDPPWIEYEKHRGAVLTGRGRSRALEVIRHHRLLESFLHDSLGYRWDEVHDEAEKLEHAISERFEERIAQHLGDPETDPHGHPIPRKDGTIPERVEVSLLELQAGAEGLVSRVSDRNSDLLRYLSSLGVRPGVRVKVVERQPFDGPLMLRIGRLEEAQALGARVCGEIHVTPIKSAPGRR
jgi:DtxR family transcriptional regulator, Mn-dependent transcriptional regulator